MGLCTYKGLLMKRPDFLECTTEAEREDWQIAHSRSGQSTSPANSVKSFCDDCTLEYFAYSAERGLCFQARIQDEEITLDEIYGQLKESPSAS